MTMLTALIILAALLICSVVLRPASQRTKTVSASELWHASIGLPKTRAQLLLQFAWLAVTLKFCIYMIEPIYNSAIREEYIKSNGGLIGAWLSLVLLYLPFLLIYVWFAFKLSRRQLVERHRIPSIS
jgi:hypothetical protein